MTWLQRYIRHRDIVINDEVHLRRWTLLKFAGYSLRLHHFFKPDVDRCLHDHPWGFLTLILWGGYVEQTETGLHRRRPGQVLIRRATFRHSVVELPRGHCWTLILMGPKWREWGFFTREGWKHWRVFVDAPWRRPLWCDDGETDS